MYARSTTIIAEPSMVEDGITYVRDEVWPGVRQMQGCIGLSMIIDRASGKGIITTSWETEEALAASREPVAPLRERGTEVTRGSEPLVEEWEVASMHRAHNAFPDACVRTSWTQVDPADADRAIELYKTGMLPGVEQFEGFASASLLVNRETGRGVLSVAYDSREAMERTRPQAEQMRAMAEQSGIRVLEVQEFELALAHLHVPELV